MKIRVFFLLIRSSLHMFQLNNGFVLTASVSFAESIRLWASLGHQKPSTRDRLTHALT